MNFARIINKVAVDVSAAPQEQFHPDIAKDFEQVHDAVQTGWVRVDGEWQVPETVQPEPEAPVVTAAAPTVSPVEFMLLFTSPERVGLKQARNTDPVVDDFFDMIEDPRLTSIDLSKKSVRSALDYFVSKDLLAQERVEPILAGESD